MRTVLRMLSAGAIFLSLGFTHATSGQDAAVPDKDIHVLSFEGMRYSPIARAANVQGVVVIQVELDGSGKPVGVRALSGNPYLVIRAVENAKQWRFEPNTEKTAIIVYDYRIVGLCAQGVDSSQLVLEPPNLAIISACAFTVQTSSPGK